MDTFISIVFCIQAIAFTGLKLTPFLHLAPIFSAIDSPRNLSNGVKVSRRLKKGTKGGKKGANQEKVEKTKGTKGKKTKNKGDDDNDVETDDDTDVETGSTKTTKSPKEGKKGDKPNDDDPTEPNDEPTEPNDNPVASPTMSPITSPVSAQPASPSTSPTPAPNVMPVVQSDELTTPPDDFYKVISCGDAEEIVNVEVNYMYMIHVAESLDIESAVGAVTMIEEENLKAVVDKLLPCGSVRRTRRRLDTTVIGATALPKDEASGLCGDDCTVVDGGTTVFVVDEGDMDYTLLQCQVLAVVRDSMMQIESDEEGISEINLVDDDFNCDGLLDRAIPGVFNSDYESNSTSGSGSPIIAMVGIAIGTAVIALLALLLVRRRRRSDESMCSFLAFDKDGDLSSIMTPETGDTPGRQSPDRKSPTGLDSPDGSFGNMSPIAQFDPDALNMANQANNNVNVASPAAAAVLGFRDYQTDQQIVGRDSNGDFLFDNGDKEATVSVLMADSDTGSNDVPLVSPIMQAWQESPKLEPGTSLILSSIPEVGDDASVETAEIANTSRDF